MIVATTVLNELQVRVAARLMGDTFFTPATGPQISVFEEKKRDLINEIARKVGAIGMCAVVVTPEAISANEQPGLDLIVRVVVQVNENVIINQADTGTGKPALSAIVRIMQLLHGWNPGLQEGPKRSTNANRMTVAQPPFELVSQTPLLSYQANFAVPLRMDGAPYTPALGADGGNLFIGVDE